MFPVGAVVGALLAARRGAIGPTKARVIGAKYVAQGRKGVEHVVSLVVWMLASPLAFFGLFATKHVSDSRTGGLAILMLTLPMVPLLLLTYGRHYLFDHEGIEEVSPWRRRRRILYRDVVRVRRHFLNEGFVLSASNGAAMRIPDNFNGGVTLAHLLLTHLPKTSSISPAAQRKLSTWAELES